MIRYVIESTTDDNTGLECWLIVDTVTGNALDRAFDRGDADDICDFYNDRGTLDLYEDDISEYDEWQDFDPNC